jgi:hypothetical protein
MLRKPPLQVKWSVPNKKQKLLTIRERLGSSSVISVIWWWEVLFIFVDFVVVVVGYVCLRYVSYAKYCQYL